LHYLQLRLHIALVAVRARRRQIVVISQIVHMGDIVACEPVIRHVRRTLPDAFIVFVLQKNYRCLADSHPEVDYILAVECMSEWIIFAPLRLFNRTIDLNIYERSCPICGVPWKKPTGSHGVTRGNYYDHGNLLKAFTVGAGINVEPISPRVYPTPADIQVVNILALPQEYACLHAASNEEEREYPAEKWQIIVDHINTRWGIPVVEIGVKPRLQFQSPNRCLSGRESITQSAEVIRRSLMYIGSDSGPAHLANAIGAYGIILLGRYGHFMRYMPYSGNYAEGKFSEIIHHDGPVCQMPVERVIMAIDNRMSQVRKIDRCATEDPESSREREARGEEKAKDE
jgi:ADP-heptose:LPS heptosyltransferase